jgi:hypothetical protein
MLTARRRGLILSVMSAQQTCARYLVTAMAIRPGALAA